MNYLRRSILLSLLAIALFAILTGCEGDTGPAGPKGDPGEPGPGTRTIITGTVPTADTIHVIPMPGLSLSDPPLVSVFIDLLDVDEWDELPFTWLSGEGDDAVDVTSYASIAEGEVVLYFCAGFDYIMIIVE